MEQLSENRQEMNKRYYSLGIILAIGISLLAIVSVGITIGVLYFNFSQESRQDLRQRLVNIAELAALQQDGDKFEQIMSEETRCTRNFVSKTWKFAKSTRKLPSFTRCGKTIRASISSSTRVKQER